MKIPVRLLLRVPVPWVFVLCYLAGVGLEYALPLKIRWESLPAITRIGVAVFAAGAIFAGWGLLIFYKAKTTTVPGKLSSKFVTWGPYRLSRNPMYVGLTIAYLGEAGIQKQIWPVILLPLTLAYLNWIVIPLEEGRLREVFGEQYRLYCAQVRRWL